MKARPLDYLALLGLGVGWGLTVPLAKVAVSTGHQPYGLIFWQLVIVIAILAPAAAVVGGPTALKPRHLRLFVVIALTGAVLPDLFFYLAASKLPAGVLAIVMSSAPLFSLPIALALALGTDAFSWIRLAGLICGMGSILLMIGPEASLPEPAMGGAVLMALLAPALYATEGNVVAKWGTGGLNPIRTILGASLVSAVITLPIALLSGQWINPLAGFGRAEAALVAGAAAHGLVYVAYVWLVGRAGSVFTVQSAYLVTAFGVIWSILLLGEHYSAYIWAAMALLLIGIFCVQPRPRFGLAPAVGIGKDAPRRNREGPPC